MTASQYKLQAGYLGMRLSQAAQRFVGKIGASPESWEK